MEVKRCKTCGKKKRLTGFNVNNANSDKKQSSCRVCTGIANRKWKAENPDKILEQYLNWNYGISLSTYNKMLNKQKGTCAICKLTETVSNRHTKMSRLSVDHDHTTGKVRGLLCNFCNTGIGKLRESLVILRRAIKYLEKHK